MCNKALWPVETRAVCIIVYIVKFWVPNVRNGSSVMAKDAEGGVLSEIVCGTGLCMQWEFVKGVCMYFCSPVPQENV